MSWTRRHLIDVDEFSVADLDLVVSEAARFRGWIERGGGWVGNLRGYSAAFLFAEASTRTRLSFELAARRLGAETFILDPSSSSLTKGESFVDTVRNLDAIGFNVLIVRHHRTGAPNVAARHFAGHVVNAGDGWRGHPTQALLDAATLAGHFGSDPVADGVGGVLRGRKIAIVGDVLHSRVARSNAHLLALAGAQVWLCGPAPWVRGLDALPAEVTTDLGAAIRDADAVMALRVQKERMKTGSLSLAEYVERYQITEERLARLAPGAPFLHPGPINEGIEVTREVALGPRSLVIEQVRNGVPVRMAVLSIIAGASGGARVAGEASGSAAEDGSPSGLQVVEPGESGQTVSATRDLSSVIR